MEWGRGSPFCRFRKASLRRHLGTAEDGLAQGAVTTSL